MIKLNTILTITTLASLCASLTSFGQTISMETNSTVKKVPYADKILLHMHPEKVLNYLPDLTDGQIANLYGLTLKEYTDVKKVYDDQANQAARELLLNQEFASKVDMLPFKTGDTIVVLGESTTDALNSWAYILEHLLAQKRPQDSIKIINAGISGQTTTEALTRITSQVKLEPDWVIANLGGNDCIRFGSATNKTTVNLPETIDNLQAIRNIVVDNTRAALVWIAPTPIDEERAANFPPFQLSKLFLKNTDLIAVADHFSFNEDEVIDLRNDFGVPAKQELIQFDGIHLSIEGQKTIVTALINRLSQEKNDIEDENDAIKYD